MIREFLDTYEAELGKHGLPFDGVPELLDALEAAGSRWGIVTNKPEYLARQVLPLLGWDARCAVLVGGDSLPERKPHPLPLLHAAQTLGVGIADCAYVGDDLRDIEAARAAGMRSVVALWGYRLPGSGRRSGAATRWRKRRTCSIRYGGRDGHRSRPRGSSSPNWREHWPEWSVAEAFVPEEQREVASAWFALRHELTEATWAGGPAPGEAKLAWWREELQGWAKGARRHPLGSVLQKQPVPWILLADSIPALFTSRGSAPDPTRRRSGWSPSPRRGQRRRHPVRRRLAAPTVAATAAQRGVRPAGRTPVAPGRGRGAGFDPRRGRRRSGPGLGHAPAAALGPAAPRFAARAPAGSAGARTAAGLRRWPFADFVVAADLALALPRHRPQPNALFRGCSRPHR